MWRKLEDSSRNLVEKLLNRISDLTEDIKSNKIPKNNVVEEWLLERIFCEDSVINISTKIILEIINSSYGYKENF